MSLEREIIEGKLDTIDRNARRWVKQLGNAWFVVFDAWKGGVGSGGEVFGQEKSFPESS